MLSPLRLEFLPEILARFVYLKGDLLKGCCSSIFKSRITLVMRKINVFRENDNGHMQRQLLTRV